MPSPIVDGIYPLLGRGPSGLRTRSFALVDQLRVVDKRRVIQSLGRIQESELAAIDDALRLFLGLDLADAARAS